MKSGLKLSLFGAALSVGLIPTTVQAQLEGSTLAWQYFAYGGAYTGANDFVVQPGILGNFLGYFNIEADNTSITFDYSSYTGSDVWSPSGLSLAPTIYNGIAIDVISGPTITSVSIDSATNMAGFNLSDLSFTGNQIQVNWADLPFDGSTIVKLDVNSSTSTTPAPPACFAALATAGLAAARRRFKKA